MAYTLKDNLAPTTSADKTFGWGANATYMAHSWTTGSAYTLTKLAVRLLKVGSPTMSITARIYADNAGDPGTLLATSTNSISASTLTTSEADYEFLFAGVALSSGTRYFVVLYVSAVDGSNYPVWRYTSASEYRDNGPDGSTWYDDSSATQGSFRTYEGSEASGAGAPQLALLFAG